MNVQTTISFIFGSIFAISAIGVAAVSVAKVIKEAEIWIQITVMTMFGISSIIMLGLMVYVIRNILQEKNREREKEKEKGFLARFFSWLKKRR